MKAFSLICVDAFILLKGNDLQARDYPLKQEILGTVNFNGKNFRA